MGVELKPLGVVCNIQCHYCYENPLRDAGNKPPAYDIEAMKAAVLREGEAFSLFGGEPLLLPKADLATLWAWGFARFGSNGIQTNGTLIDEAHIALFRAYNVDVGISVDGPAELNDARWSADISKTRQATARTHAAIEALCREGIPPGLIVTLHRGNASADKLPALCEWFRYLDRLGVRHVRLHVLEVDSPKVREAYALSAQNSVQALLRLDALERTELTSLRFDVFRDMRAMLMGRDEKTTCVWSGCDPLTTQAVRGIEGDGQATNCSRTNKEGIDFAKSASPGFERYLALYRTSQEHGGCKDCRFFLMCKGQCPGTAIDGDWRNRSESCEVWKSLYEHFEHELLHAGDVPLSCRPERRAVEEIVVGRWEDGRNTSIAAVLADLAQQQSPAPASLDAADTDVRNRDAMRDFKRTAWVSDKARAVWEPRLARIGAAWREVEWLSVPAGLRACAITTLAPALFLERARAWAAMGLSALPLSAHGRGPVADEARDGAAVPRVINAFRVAVAAPHDLATLAHALEHHDDATISRLLGVPACCAAHRRSLWTARPTTDPTWSIAAGASPRDPGETRVEVNCTWQTNILWRWLAICAIPHLPCRLDCAPSREIADQLIALGRQAGYGQEMDWMCEVLSWPAEWTALHGIAITNTPILKVSTRSDVTDKKFTVRLNGETYPTEGATGLSFPYRRQTSHRFTTSRAFELGVEHVRSSIGAQP